jgi:hypothetical protein
MNTAEDRLIHWINERYAIYAKRTNGAQPPWTDDPILQNYRFCNVHRENDKVTKWIASNWRNQNADNVFLVSSLVLARMFNLPDHLVELQPFISWDLEDMCRVSKERRARGEKCFNGAYLITTCGVKMDKIDYVYRVVKDVEDMVLWPDDIPTTLTGMHKVLTSVKGLGDFLAAQVIADLKNIPGHPLWEAPDWWSWCAPGPGSRRGLERLVGAYSASRGRFNASASLLHREIVGRLNPMPNICMQNFQNCLCEFDKYDRTYLGEGKPKQRYHSV